MAMLLIYGCPTSLCGKIELSQDATEPTPKLLTPYFFSHHSLLTLACGPDFFLALTIDGHLWHFGKINNSQPIPCIAPIEPIGPIELIERIKLNPLKIEPFLKVQFCKIEAGKSHMLALSEEGDLYVWGWNQFGQLGTGNLRNLDRPTKLQMGQIKFTSISCGSTHSVALSVDGLAYIWGGQNIKLGEVSTLLKSGELDEKWKNWYLKPELISKELIFSWISAGHDCTFAGTKRNKVYSWGLGSFGQLGHGDTTDYSSPKLIEFLSKLNIIVKKISNGFGHTLILTSNGDLYSWGSNIHYEIGHEQKKRYLIPTKIESKIKFTDIVTGLNFSIAIDEEGQCYSWGEAKQGSTQSGQGKEMILFPEKLENKFGFEKIFASNDYWIAVSKQSLTDE